METVYLTPLSREWESRLRQTYQDLSSKQLAAELLALSAEVRNASRFDPDTRHQVVTLAAGRLRLARDEVRQRAADGKS